MIEKNDTYFDPEKVIEEQDYEYVEYKIKSLIKANQLELAFHLSFSIGYTAYYFVTLIMEVKQKELYENVKSCYNLNICYSPKNILIAFHTNDNSNRILGNTDPLKVKNKLFTVILNDNKLYLYPSPGELKNPSNIDLFNYDTYKEAYTYIKQNYLVRYAINKSKKSLMRHYSYLWVLKEKLIKNEIKD